MRVLLFVQTGDGRPKCKVRFDADNFIGGRDSMPSWAADRCEYFGADRWWLVEAENAEHGRGVIALAEHVNELMAPNWDKNCGRILASWGKA